MLLLGTGLTKVDVALELAARGHAGPIAALSRRGLIPHRHEVVAPCVCAPPGAGAEPLSARVRERRRRAEAVGWRAAIDELRPVTADLWCGATSDQKRRFLRHLRSWWDIHRHRMAPKVADAVADLRARGRLNVQAGRLIDTQAQAGAVEVRWRSRGTGQVQTLSAARIINCTGAGGDLARASDPLLRRLIQTGTIRADPWVWAWRSTPPARPTAGGAPNSRLYAAGPITQGYAWEFVAVPDIRSQVAALAQTLAQRSWTN